MREGIIRAGAYRTGGWEWGNAYTGAAGSSIGYQARAFEDGTGWVRLHYTRRSDGEVLDYCIAIRETRPNFEGLRWWFVCPLVTNGRPCGRRVGKLYLGGGYFGCRHCQDLTYRSCQESHRAARSLATESRLISRLGLFDAKTATPGPRICLLRAAQFERPRPRRRRHRQR